MHKFYHIILNLQNIILYLYNCNFKIKLCECFLFAISLMTAWACASSVCFAFKKSAVESGCLLREGRKRSFPPRPGDFDPERLRLVFFSFFLSNLEFSAIFSRLANLLLLNDAPSDEPSSRNLFSISWCKFFRDISI